MTTYSRQAAAQAADENTTLRLRVAQLEEDEKSRTMAQSSASRTGANATKTDTLKSQNSSLKEEIKELERQLSELKQINVVELQNEFTRLDQRRGFLNNENAGLRSILGNQRRGVKKATSTINAQQTMRKENDSQHAQSKEDIQMFREKRDQLSHESKKLAKEEKQLQKKLDSMPARSADLERELHKVQSDNKAKERQINELEAALEAAGAGNMSEEEDYVPANDEVAQLREEYVKLKDEIKRAKQ